MPKTLLLLLFIVPCAVLLAQEKTTTPNTNAASTTVSGCLEFSSHEYRLVDSAGQSTQLQYQANRLIHYVGQQVEITGKPGIKTIGTTVDGLASSADEIPVFDVSTVTSAGGACAANSGN